MCITKYADEMGLGKTVQAIGMIAYLAEHKDSAGSKSLVVAPKTLMSNWLKEFAKWLPSLRVLHLGGTKEVHVYCVRACVRVCVCVCVCVDAHYVPSSRSILNSYRRVRCACMN